MNSPEISIVVVATRNSLAFVDRCLDSLRLQSRADLAEQIVVDCATDEAPEAIRQKYPGAKWVHLTRPTAQPGLIREGLRQTRGRVIAVTDDCCTFPRDWLERLHRAHEEEYEVIGGAVENAGAKGLVGWACFFADYGPFMRSAERRVTHLLAGNHVSYKRRVLERELGSMEDGFWKVFFHRDLVQQGIRFLFDPELIAYYWCPDSFRDFLRRYYRNAILFAGQRCKGMAFVSRYLRVMGTPALPALLFFQRLRAGIANKERRAEFLKALPLIAVFVTVWAAGEFRGYLRGYVQACPAVHP